MSKKANLREYQSWRAMKLRCTRPVDPNFERYGGRGITVCDHWMKSFTAFLADLGPRPPGTTLDRIDSDKNYEPGNCRWATPAQQALNRSTTILLEVRGEVLCLKHCAKKYGISLITLRKRLQMGFSVEEALAMPKWSRLNRIDTPHR